MEEIIKEIEDALVKVYGETLREYDTAREMANAVYEALEYRWLG